MLALQAAWPTSVRCVRFPRYITVTFGLSQKFGLTRQRPVEIPVQGLDLQCLRPSPAHVMYDLVGVVDCMGTTDGTAGDFFVFTGELLESE